VGQNDFFSWICGAKKEKGRVEEGVEVREMA